MKIKASILIVLLLSITACANTNKLEERIEELETQNTILENLIYEESCEIMTTFKDEIELEVIILDKLELNDQIKHYLIVTLLDTDHNTPLMIGVENEKLIEKFEIGEITSLNLYVIMVIEDSHQRFEFWLID